MRVCGLIPAAFLLTASLAAQDFNDLRIEKTVDKLLFAEGPVWSREGFLLICDPPSNRIMKFTPGEGTSLFRENSNGTDGLAIDTLGRIYACEARTHRVTRTDKKGKTETIADKWEGKRLNAPNDIVVRHDSNVYFTDPAFGNQLESRELNFFGIYRIAPKGDVEIVAKPKGRPNGIALSPNGRLLYVTNSDEKRVYSYDLDKAGAPSNERVLISNIDGVPGGIRTDEKGNLYVAGKGVSIYSAEGKPIRNIPFSEKPSNVAFGEADMQSLYVTARTSVYRVRVPVKGW